MNKIIQIIVFQNLSDIIGTVNIGAGSHSDPELRNRFLNECHQYSTHDQAIELVYT